MMIRKGISTYLGSAKPERQDSAAAAPSLDDSVFELIRRRGPMDASEIMAALDDQPSRVISALRDLESFGLVRRREIDGALKFEA